MTRLRLSKEMRRLNPQLTTQDTRELAGCEDTADLLLAHLRVLAPDIPEPVREFGFLRFRVDLAWPGKLAVEVDGGQHKPGGGRHGSVRDYQKLRILVLYGWLVLRFHAKEVRGDPVGCIADIRAALALVAEPE